MQRARHTDDGKGTVVSLRFLYPDTRDTQPDDDNDSAGLSASSAFSPRKNSKKRTQRELVSRLRS